MQVTRKAAVLEIAKTVDVLVVGGGPAGVGAAVAAARYGADVLLLEKRGFLGGNITACYVENCNYFLAGTPFHSEGIYAEIERGCKETFGSDNIRERNPNAFSSEYLKIFLDRFVAASGAEIWLHSFVNEVITTGGHIDAVIIQTKKGPLAVAAGMVIDTTGDADVAFASGVPYEQGRATDGLCQPGSVNVRFVGADVAALTADGRDGLGEIGADFKRRYRSGETGLPCKRQDLPFGRLTPGGQVSYANYSCAYGLDPTDNRDLSRGEIECRGYIHDLHQFLKATYSELSGIEIASIAPEIGFRDSRRIIGQYHLTIEDMEENRQFEDVIAVFPRFYDMLAPDANMEGDGKVEGKGYAGHIYESVVDGRTWQVPYRAMVPVNADNLLAAGRCLSADHVAESGTRAISLCCMTGQAAGIAAALCVKDGKAPQDVNIKLLQKKLRESGIVLPL